MVGPVIQVGGAVAAHTVHRAGVVGLILAEPEVNGLTLGDGAIAVQIVVDAAVASALFQSHGRAAVGLHGQTCVGLDDSGSGTGDVGIGFWQGAQGFVLGIQRLDAAVQFIGRSLFISGQGVGFGEGLVHFGQGVGRACLVSGVLPVFQFFGCVGDAVCLVGCQGCADLLDLGGQRCAGCIGGVLGIIAGSGLLDGGALAQGIALDHDVIVLAGQQVIGADVAGHGSDNVFGFAEFEADVGDLASLFTIEVNGQRTIAAVGLIVDEGYRVPRTNGHIAKADLVLADAGVRAINAVAHLAVIGQQVQAVASGADSESGAHSGLARITAGFLDHHIGQQGELGTAEQILTIGDGGVVFILIVPLGGYLQNGAPGLIGQGCGVGRQGQAAVILQHLVKELGAALRGLAVDSQPADNRGLGAGGGNGVVDDLLFIQGEVCLIDDIAAAAGEVQVSGIAQGVALRIGDNSGHRAGHTPPLTVGTGQGVGTGGQGQGIGQGLARLVVVAVDAGSGLIGSAAVALGTCIGIHQAPGSGIGLKLVERIVHQQAAQCLFVEFVGLGGAASHIGDLAGNRINEVKSIAGDDFVDVDADSELLPQRVDSVLYIAVDRAGAAGVGCQGILVHIPFDTPGIGGTVSQLDLDFIRQAGHTAAGHVVVHGRQFGQHFGHRTAGGFQAGTDGVQCVDLEGAGFEHDLDGVVPGRQVRQDVGFAAGGGCLGGCVFGFQLAVHVDIDDSRAIVTAHDGKTIAVGGKGKACIGGAGGRNGAVPVIGTAAAGIVDGPVTLVLDTVVLAVDHGGGIGDAALDGLDFQVVGVDLLPVGADFDTAGEHRVGIIVLGNTHIIDVSIDGAAQTSQLQVVLALGVLSHSAVGHLGADAEQLPAAGTVDLQRVAAVVPVHAGLGTDSQAFVTARLGVGQGDIDGSAVIHPAPVTHDGGRVTAVPLVDAGLIFLLEPAALDDPGAMGIQHVAGLVAAGNDVILQGLLASGNVISGHLAFLDILEVIGIEVIVGCIGVFAGGICIQHTAGPGLDVIAVSLLGGEAGGRGIQRGSGHNAVGRHGDGGDAVFDGGILAFLQVAVGHGSPDVQGLHGDVHIVCDLNSEGLFVPGVVDEHRGEVLFIRGSQGHVAGAAIDTGGSVFVIAGAKGRKGGIGQHAPDAVGVGIVLPAGLGKLGDVSQHVEDGVIVDVAAPGVAGREQFLVAVLDALVERTDGRLEHVHGAAGTHKGVGDAVQQGQGTLVATDGVCAVLGGLILLQFGVTEGGAALAVPDFLVVHIGHLDVVIGGVGAVVEADGIHCIIHTRIAKHQGNNVQGLVLVRSNDLDVVISGNGFLSEVIGEFVLVLQRVGKVLDDLAIGILGLVLIGVDIVDDIAVLFVGIKDGLFVPLINSGVLLIAVGFDLDPVGILPPQDGDLDVGVDLFGIGRHDKAGGTGSVGFLVLVTHGAGLGAGGVVAVVAHFHLDVGEQRVTVLAAKEILHHGPVGLRVFGLVVQQQVAGGVAVEHTQALVGPAVDVLGGSPDLRAV